MKKTKILIIVGIVITVFIGLFGLTYAYLRTQILGNEEASSVIVQMGDIDIVFSDSQYLNDTLEEPGWTTTKSFTVTNNGSLPGTYSVYWETLINELVNKADLTYTITSTFSGGTLSQTQVPGSGYDIPIFPSVTIGPGATQVYTMVLNYANTSSDQSSDMGKILYGKVKITPTSYASALPTLADAIKTNEPLIRTVVDDTMFQGISNDEQTGLWLENRTDKTEDNLPTYFYRGAVQNNYVSFADKMWRIVRINEDGSVKLILGGNSATDGYGGTTTAFNSNTNSSTYVDYDNATNTLKATNQNWYTTHLNLYDTYITNTKFCNDKSVAASLGSDILYGALSRVSGYSLDGNFTSNARTKTPQYKCPTASDNLLYKIGALTADEVAYAGGMYGINNESYYLYDNVKNNEEAGYWWLLSPYNYNSNTNIASVLHVSTSDNSGHLNNRDVISILGFRPVISLSSTTIILDGMGTKDDPYIITQ